MKGCSSGADLNLTYNDKAAEPPDVERPSAVENARPLAGCSTWAKCPIVVTVIVKTGYGLRVWNPFGYYDTQRDVHCSREKGN